jgi:glucose/arabinose dehydrogenase
MARGGTACALVAAILFAAAGPAAHATPHPGYRVPFDNPFVATPGARPEVYLYGMRNPYRWSFDLPSGDMYVADVGGNLREEVTYLPGPDIAGANLGWHCFEGTRIQKVCRPPNYFPPAHEYPSSPDVIIGGYVVHDPDMPSFAGQYLYGRYLSGVWLVGPRASGPDVNVSAAITGVTSFGQDGAGRLYATSYDGPLYRLGENAGALTATQIGEFKRPTQVLSPPADSSRLFVVEKRGRVKLLEGGVVTDFLDISNRVQDRGYEEGLLGFLPAPDYNNSGRVFAFYSDNRGDIQVDAYRRTARDPDRSRASTRRPILTIQHNQGDHHHGGQMNFGSDGYLYLSTGDGDLKVDPQNDAQNLGSLLGKILRIDVRAGKADTKAPTLRASAAGAQQVLRLKAAVAYGSCSEWCALSASARMVIGGHAYTPQPARAAPPAHRRGRLELELTPSCARALKRALARRRAVSMSITMRAADATGNSPKAVTRTVRVSG